MIKQEWPETLTAQEIFDHCAEHIRSQKERCAVGGACSYRGKEPGSACAVGALLTDAEATRVDAELRNGSDVSALKRDGLLPDRLLPHIRLLQELQPVHDGFRNRPLPPMGENELHQIALRFGLTYTPPTVP